MGKIVVKKIQSQASNTAFQIPSADGTTGQVLKTDGSANLGWTDKSSKIGSAGIDYTMPPSDGTAGQVLQTNGTGGVLEFVTPASNPLSTPDGNHQGIRLCDKYFFGLNNAAAASSVTLTVPSSYTTDPSDVLSLEVWLSGMSITGGNQNGNFLVTTLAQDGVTTTRQTGTTQNFYNGYYNYYKDYNQQGNRGVDPTNGNNVKWYLGSDFYPYSSANGTTRWPGTSSSGSSYASHPAGQMRFVWFNAHYFPQGYWTGAMGKTSYHDQELPQSKIVGKVGQYDSTTATSASYHKLTPSNVKHSMGFKFEYEGSRVMYDGVIMLFARFKDGVVS